jgi:hypothetical protein
MEKDAPGLRERREKDKICFITTCRFPAFFRTKHILSGTARQQRILAGGPERATTLL